jgi:hypothetical protein
MTETLTAERRGVGVAEMSRSRTPVITFTIARTGETGVQATQVAGHGDRLEDCTTSMLSGQEKTIGNPSWRCHVLELEDDGGYDGGGHEGGGDDHMESADDRTSGESGSGLHDCGMIGENEMTFGATDIPTRAVAYFRDVLKDHEAKLVNAKKQREAVLFDIRKANAAVDMGDQRARLELNGLNKQDVAAGRLILSIEAETAEARKRLKMAEVQSATAAARRASADDAVLVRDKLFEVATPDGRKVRHRHHSLEALQKALQPGYSITGQVFGMNADDTGGFVSRPGAPSMMKALLESQGHVLLEWLAAHGLKAA